MEENIIIDNFNDLEMFISEIINGKRSIVFNNINVHDTNDGNKSKKLSIIVNNVNSEDLKYLVQ